MIEVKISFHLLDAYSPTSASAVARTRTWKTRNDLYVSLRTLFEARYEEVLAQYLVLAVKIGVVVFFRLLA
jgi:hypothetical protein